MRDSSGAVCVTQPSATSDRSHERSSESRRAGKETEDFNHATREGTHTTQMRSILRKTSAAGGSLALSNAHRPKQIRMHPPLPLPPPPPLPLLLVLLHPLRLPLLLRPPLPSPA